MWRVGTAKGDIERDVCALARQCQPPLPEAEAMETVKSALLLRRKFKERTIQDWLNVTPQERAQIPHWREHGESPPATSVTPTERQQIILDIVNEIGVPPSLRVMRKELHARGIPACPETIRRDYLQLSKSHVDTY